MKRPTTAAAFLFVLLPLSAANQSGVTPAEARSLVAAVLFGDAVNDPGVTVELDREHGQCAIYHAYRTSKPPSMTLTTGWWSIDIRTAEMWDDLKLQRMTNQRIVAIQQAIRKRLGVARNEVLRSISTPCYERDSSK
jgi:hypothetical protein